MIINTRKLKRLAQIKGRKRLSREQELEQYLAFRYPDVPLTGSLGAIRRNRLLRQGEGVPATGKAQGRS
jgi:hypothetical protein